MRLTALNNWVVVRPADDEERRSHGLLIAGEAHPSVTGTVESVGPDAVLSFGAGQKVVFPAYGGYRFALGGEQFAFLLDHEILGVAE